jgi:hypothetical protein
VFHHGADVEPAGGSDGGAVEWDNLVHDRPL